MHLRFRPTHPRRCHARLSFIVSVLLLGVGMPAGVSGQSANLVYISNVTGTEVDGSPQRTVEAQTAAALDRLGEALAQRGLSYTDVVVSNVFLRDARHFQGMNGVYRTYFETGAPTRATVQADLLDPEALFQISVVATGDPKEIIVPSGLKSPALPYSWGIRVGTTLFLSGATSRSPELYTPVEGDVPTQTRRVFGNIGFVLEEAGMSYADLVSCKVFLDDPRSFGAMNGAYAEFVPAEDPPARATVRAPLMNVVFSTEIQCVAVEAPDRRVVRPEARGRSPYSPGIDTGERVYVAEIGIQRISQDWRKRGPRWVRSEVRWPPHRSGSRTSRRCGSTSRTSGTGSPSSPYSTRCSVRTRPPRRWWARARWVERSSRSRSPRSVGRDHRRRATTPRNLSDAGDRVVRTHMA